MRGVNQPSLLQCHQCPTKFQKCRQTMHINHRLIRRIRRLAMAIHQITGKFLSPHYRPFPHPLCTQLHPLLTSRCLTRTCTTVAIQERPQSPQITLLALTMLLRLQLIINKRIINNIRPCTAVDIQINPFKGIPESKEGGTSREINAI